MARLEDAFQVRHIATFPLATFDPGEPVERVLARYPGYDQIPMRDGERVVAVLHRRSREVRPVELGDVVSAYEPLAKFLPLLKDATYRLVSEGGQITGIVTRSDILKLPVRLFSFALVTHLELLMTDIIRASFSNADEWGALLSSSRQTKLKDKKENLAADTADPDLLELTDFCDKRTILRKRYKLGGKFEKELGEVEELRNQVAHAATYAGSSEELREFVARVQLTNHWIEELSETLASIRRSQSTSVPIAPSPLGGRPEASLSLE